MDKLMKTLFCILSGIAFVCALITTIVSILRLEWASLIWLIITVLCAFLAKNSIDEYKE